MSRVSGASRGDEHRCERKSTEVHSKLEFIIGTLRAAALQ